MRCMQMPMPTRNNAAAWVRHSLPSFLLYRKSTSLLSFLDAAINNCDSCWTATNDIRNQIPPSINSPKNKCWRRICNRYDNCYLTWVTVTYPSSWVDVAKIFGRFDRSRKVLLSCWCCVAPGPARPQNTAPSSSFFSQNTKYVCTVNLNRTYGKAEQRTAGFCV